MKVIETPQKYLIQPKDIDTTRHPFGAFGKNETEISAKWLVRLAQQKGTWLPFTEAEIEEFYNAEGHKDFWFNGLDTRWLIKRDDQYWFTHEFVSAYFQAAPMEK